MRARDDAAILILFKKQEDQKTQIVKFEKNRFEECEKLEAKVAA